MFDLFLKTVFCFKKTKRTGKTEIRCFHFFFLNAKNIKVYLFTIFENCFLFTKAKKNKKNKENCLVFSFSVLQKYI